jgi:hypothetical protein
MHGGEHGDKAERDAKRDKHGQRRHDDRSISLPPDAEARDAGVATLNWDRDRGSRLIASLQLSAQAVRRLPGLARGSVMRAPRGDQI